MYGFKQMKPASLNTGLCIRHHPQSSVNTPLPKQMFYGSRTMTHLKWSFVLQSCEINKRQNCDFAKLFTRNVSVRAKEPTPGFYFQAFPKACKFWSQMGCIIHMPFPLSAPGFMEAPSEPLGRKTSHLGSSCCLETLTCSSHMPPSHPSCLTGEDNTSHSPILLSSLHFPAS